MKKFTFILLFLIVLFNLHAHLTKSSKSQINFDLSLKDIVLLVQSGKIAEIDMNQYIVLEGVVSSREIIIAYEENFIARLELSYADWEGLDKINMYQCYIQLSGLEFATMIPTRRSRTPNLEEIPVNTKILVLGRYLKYSEDENGNKYPIIEGYKIRKIN